MDVWGDDEDFNDEFTNYLGNVRLIDDIHSTQELKMDWGKVFTKLAKGCGKGLAASVPLTAAAGDFGDPTLTALLTAVIGVFDAFLNWNKHRGKKK